MINRAACLHSSTHTAAVGQTKWFTRHICILAPACQAYGTAKAKNACTQSTRCARSEAGGSMHEGKASELSRTLRFSPSDTCATDLCLDWQTDDDTVGRDRDKPLQVSKSAKCGVKKMQLAAFCLRFVSCTSCFRWWVLLIAMCHTCCCVQQQIDQLTLDTFPLVKTPSEECIRDQLETCICTSAQSYHRA
jgi:hypothetical protein